MVIIGLILLPVALYFLLRLLYDLAAIALPVFAAFSAGFLAYHHGVGTLDSILIALATGLGTLLVAQFAFRAANSLAIRAVIALTFATPAVAAGYYATLGLEHIFIASGFWSQPLAIVCAAVVGWTSTVKLAGSPGEPGGASLWQTLQSPAATDSAHRSAVPDGFA
jgi:hypothetical protein